MSTTRTFDGFSPRLLLGEESAVTRPETAFGGITDRVSSSSLFRVQPCTVHLPLPLRCRRNQGAKTARRFVLVIAIVREERLLYTSRTAPSQTRRRQHRRKGDGHSQRTRLLAHPPSHRCQGRQANSQRSHREVHLTSIRLSALPLRCAEPSRAIQNANYHSGSLCGLRHLPNPKGENRMIWEPIPLFTIAAFNCFSVKPGMPSSDANAIFSGVSSITAQNTDRKQVWSSRFHGGLVKTDDNSSTCFGVQVVSWPTRKFQVWQ